MYIPYMTIAKHTNRYCFYICKLKLYKSNKTCYMNIQANYSTKYKKTNKLVFNVLLCTGPKNNHKRNAAKYSIFKIEKAKCVHRRYAYIYTGI